MDPLPDPETTEDDERRRPLLRDLFKATPLKPITAPIREEWDRFASAAVPSKVDQAGRRKPGERFGRYVLLGELGRGGMGVVYRAHDPALDRTVAIKLYGRELAAESETTLERFTQEAKATARLSHRGIVRIHDVGREEDVPYLSMDLVEGTSLDLLLHDLPLRDCLSHIVQVAQALDHAHAHGVVHRDVKPSNIIIDAQGQAVLVDFGVARDLTRQTRLTRTGCIVGTVVRMSPEQVHGQPDRIGPKSDVYALGVLLYEAVCGELPFEGGAVEIMVMILKGDVTWPQDLTPPQPELEAITLRCMEKDPDDRYASAGALASALVGVLSGTRGERVVSDGPPKASKVGVPARSPHGEPKQSGPRRVSAAKSNRRARGTPAGPLGWVALAVLLVGGVLGLLQPSATDDPHPEPEPLAASPMPGLAVAPGARGDADSPHMEVVGEVEQPSDERDEAKRALQPPLDTTPPALRVLSPGASPVSSATVILRGVVAVADLDRLLVNDRPCVPASDGSFEAQVELEGEGGHQVVVEAYDVAGNRARVTQSVIYDATAPTLLLEAPAEGALTRSTHILVRGRLSDANLPREVRIDLAGSRVATASVDSKGCFALEVSLPEGRSTLEVQCQDPAGHRASARRVVVRDSRAPVITLARELPSEVYGTRGRHLVLTGSVDDPTAKMTIGGRSLKVSPKGRFRARTRLIEGANPVQIVAVDDAGNRGHFKGVVNYARRRPKSTPPRVLFHETFSKPSGRKGDSGTLLEGGVIQSEPTDRIFAAVIQMADYRTNRLVTLQPGAILRLRYRLSERTQGSFKLQLYCPAVRDNLSLFIPLPTALDWQETEISLDRLQTGRPLETVASVPHTCSSIQLLVGRFGESVVLEIDDLLIYVPSGQR